MDIDEKQLKEKPKCVGTLKGHKVYRILTKGGFNMLVTSNGSSFDTLASAPHAGIAAHIAQQKNPEIQWSELSKSEFVDPNSELVKKYTKITEQIVDFQKTNP